MKKKSKAVVKEQVEVEIIESKESHIVGHFTDRFHATGTSIDFSTYMFRIKVEGDDDKDPIHDDSNPYSCVVYMDPKVASDLSFRLNTAIRQYERKHGIIVEK